MIAYLHHVWNDPLSMRETLKVELMVLPLALILFAAWCGFRGRDK